MTDRNDALEARRWFRERLTAIGQQYPELKEPAQQQRLAAYLTDDTAEEDIPCPASPPATPEDAPKAVD